jgi:predicted porin
MKKLLSSTITIVAFTLFLGFSVVATDALAQDVGGATPAPATARAPAAPATETAAAPAAPQPATCSNVRDFITTNCPLSWYGITVYGTIDIGGTWLSHGVQANPKSSVGNEFLLSKNSNKPSWNLAPSAMSQSNIGIKGVEPLNWPAEPDLKFVFLLEAGFNPVYFKLANGPGSVAQNKGVPLGDQNANADSSRAGQFYNSQGYMGLSDPTYGTLTVFRQNALTLDGVVAYDPLYASYAFSPLGYQGTTCGGGDTEDCRYTTSVKYRVNYGPLRASAIYQFGGYDLNNGSDGAVQVGAGGDIHDVAGGTVSLDGIYSYTRDAVSISLAGNTLPAQLPQVLTATISDNTAWMALARYENSPVKLYAGYEWIQFAPPTNTQTSFTDIAGDPLCVNCSALNNTNINNTLYNFQDKVQQIAWAGARYALTDEWTLAAAYYQYWQNSFGAGASCSNSSKSTCSGTYKAVSFAADWQFAAKFDAYAGVMWQSEEGGFANGFLHRHMIDPAAGFRFRF